MTILEGPQFRYIRINKELADLNGLPVEYHLGKTLLEVLPHAKSKILREMQRVVETGEPIRAREFSIELPSQPEPFHLVDWLIPLNVDGKSDAVLAIVFDQSTLKKSEAALSKSLSEKEILLRELHHRVKNNLQIVSSIVNLQFQQLNLPRVNEQITNVRNRIQAMAAIHEMLYLTDNLEKIDLESYLKKWAVHLSQVYHMQEGTADFKFETKPVILTMDKAIPCSLIINELITNALQHAFTTVPKGQIRIKTYEDEGEAFIIIEDNGSGLPAGFDNDNISTLGLSIVHILVEQLEGKITFESEEGTTVRLSFPL